VLAADFDVITRDCHGSISIRQRAEAPFERHELIRNVLRANLVSALLDGRAQLSHLLLINVRRVPYLLIEVGQLASSSGDLNILRGAALGISGGRATADGVLGTLNWTTCPY
jgi:hypothetical protein